MLQIKKFPASVRYCQICHPTILRNMCSLRIYLYGIVMQAKDALCSIKTNISILKNNCTKEVLYIVHCTMDRGPKSESIEWFIEDQHSRRRMIGSSPSPSPLYRPCKLHRVHTGRLIKGDILPTGEGPGGGGAKSYDGKRDWFSINHSILAGLNVQDKWEDCPHRSPGIIVKMTSRCKRACKSK